MVVILIGDGVIRSRSDTRPTPRPSTSRLAGPVWAQRSVSGRCGLRLASRRDSRPRAVASPASGPALVELVARAPLGPRVVLRSLPFIQNPHYISAYDTNNLCHTRTSST